MVMLAASQLLPVVGFVRRWSEEEIGADRLTEQVVQGLQDLLPWLEESSRNMNTNGHRSRTGGRSF